MPRPPARRNRVAPQNARDTSRRAKTSVNAALSHDNSNEVNDNEIGCSSTPDRVTGGSDGLMAGEVRTANGQQPREQTPKMNHTPTATVNEHAIESSPAERIGTGSRPPTRARGYSSTLSLAGRKADVSSRIGGTPGFESSILSNFRRRPRQPSILQMMQADDSSDLDDDDFLGGLSPEDESTPFNITWPKSLLPAKLDASPSNRPLPSSPSSKDSKKRKRTPIEGDDVELDLNSTVHTPRSSHAGSPELGSHTESLRSPNHTMAIPFSSSPGSPTLQVRGGGETWSSQHRRKEADGTNDLEDVAINRKLSRVATSTLQAKFLPRRRIRSRKSRQDPGDEEASEDSAVEVEGSDEDELAASFAKRSKRSNVKGLIEAKSLNTKVKKGLDTNGRFHGRRKNKDNTKAVRHDGPPRRNHHTYSRHDSQIANKENYISDDSSALSSPPPSDVSDSERDVPLRKSGNRVSSRELEQQVRKFAEIDKWQMDFEEVSVSGSQSSPMR